MTENMVKHKNGKEKRNGNDSTSLTAHTVVAERATNLHTFTMHWFCCSNPVLSPFSLSLSFSPIRTDSNEPSSWVRCW